MGAAGDQLRLGYYLLTQHDLRRQFHDISALKRAFSPARELLLQRNRSHEKNDAYCDERRFPGMRVCLGRPGMTRSATPQDETGWEKQPVIIHVGKLQHRSQL